MFSRPWVKIFLTDGRTVAIRGGEEVPDLEIRVVRKGSGALHCWVDGVETAAQAVRVEVQTGPAPPPAPVAKPLVPPYYLQRDSLTRHAERMCFSSCVAMIVSAYLPNALVGSNGDDQYLSRVMAIKGADTTFAWAHIQALHEGWGLTASWSQRLTLRDLDERLERGVLTSTGLLHHGVIGGELSGGHHILPYARTAKGYLCHDPYGELDMVRGTWARVGTSVATSPGKSVEYSRENFERRWCPKGDGWGLLVERPPAG